ncbi:hypothetical protein D3C72_1233810 [compost metagenome]
MTTPTRLCPYDYFLIYDCHSCGVVGTSLTKTARNKTIDTKVSIHTARAVETRKEKLLIVRARIIIADQVKIAGIRDSYINRIITGIFCTNEIGFDDAIFSKSSI